MFLLNTYLSSNSLVLLCGLSISVPDVTVAEMDKSNHVTGKQSQITAELGLLLFVLFSQ